ncbi:hypothetical protein KC335_g26 [Hortaea werneckii]|nr:hypothetical protein KC335_g26 [Hortaea werneckii]
MWRRRCTEGTIKKGETSYIVKTHLIDQVFRESLLAPFLPRWRSKFVRFARRPCLNMGVRLVPPSCWGSGSNAHSVSKSLSCELHQAR